MTKLTNRVRKRIRDKAKSLTRSIPAEAWPTMRQEATIRRVYSDSNGHADRAKLADEVGVPLRVVNAVIRWHQRTKNNQSVGGPTWFGEQYAPPGEVIRCPKCQARLAVWIPRHAVLGCRVCRVKGER